MRDDRPRTHRTVPFLLGLALMTAGCDPTEAGRPDPPGLTGGWQTAGCEFSRERHTMRMGGREMLVTPPALEAVMAKIERSGRDDYPQSYAGLEVDQREVKAIVYRVPNASFDDVIRRAAQDTCVEVRDAAHTLADLLVWQRRVDADLDAWAARGVRISTVTPRHDGAGLEVGVPDVPASREQIIHRYGMSAPLIFVEQGPVVPLTTDGPTIAPSGPPQAPPEGG